MPTYIMDCVSKFICVAICENVRRQYIVEELDCKYPDHLDAVLRPHGSSLVRGKSLQLSVRPWNLTWNSKHHPLEKENHF